MPRSRGVAGVSAGEGRFFAALNSSVSERDLHLIVYRFLVERNFEETAQSFLRDSGLPADAAWHKVRRSIPFGKEREKRKREERRDKQNKKRERERKAEKRRERICQKQKALMIFLYLFLAVTKEKKEKEKESAE